MDTKTAGLIGTIAKVIIGVLGAVFCLLIVFNSEAIDEGVEDKLTYLSGGLNITYIAMILCVGAVVIFGLIHFLRNIGKSKGMLFGLIGFAAVLGIAYAMADNKLTLDWEGMGVTEQMSKLSGMGIYAFLILLVVSVLVALASEVLKLIR